METQELPTRLIICVDGTWCTADGCHNRRHDNISNVYRICASIHVGVCEDSQGRRIIQDKQYIPGIGSTAASVERLTDGIFGTGCMKQIQDIYEKCCLLGGAEDEAWLYGFSRGAFVVRAVAGLLHYLGALRSAGKGDFEKEYKGALEVYRNMQKGSTLGPGQIHNFLSESTRPALKIKFIGAFDTVKAVDDHRLYDLSFNLSIQNLRHALALNEHRSAFAPEILMPEFDRNSLKNRTFTQAWFIGAHIDLGGSAAKDGLALYPLQWMLLESQKMGLVCKFDGSFKNRAPIDNPLEVVFPQNDSKRWSFKAANGLEVQMHDLRRANALPKYANRYCTRLNQRKRLYFRESCRRTFGSDGTLQGYCSYAPQGTIIHPSVYLILDGYRQIEDETRRLPSYPHLEAWRDQIILHVCGNCGVGKSTLINQVFGVRVTESSDRATGVHDINTSITTEDRPDLMIYDSGGFEAGSKEEIEAVQKFVVERSSFTDVKERLHIIWVCSADLEKRILEIETELLAVEDGRFDALVAVSRKDRSSIELLTETTARCFDDDQVRLLYIAAQVTRIDLKVNTAIATTMRVYRHTARSAVFAGFVPLVATTTRVTVSALLCKDIVACFEAPMVTAKTIEEIFKSVIWADVGHNFAVFIAECIVTTGIFFAPMGIPAVAGAINAPLVVLAITRLILMLACDVILLLVLAFKRSTHRYGQPFEEDIEVAARDYRGYAKEVHAKLNKIVPRTNMIDAFRFQQISKRFTVIVNEYKKLFTEGIASATPPKVSFAQESVSRNTIVDTTLL